MSEFELVEIEGTGENTCTSPLFTKEDETRSISTASMSSSVSFDGVGEKIPDKDHEVCLVYSDYGESPSEVGVDIESTRSQETALESRTGESESDGEPVTSDEDLKTPFQDNEVRLVYSDYSEAPSETNVEYDGRPWNSIFARSISDASLRTAASEVLTAKGSADLNTAVTNSEENFSTDRTSDGTSSSRSGSSTSSSSSVDSEYSTAPSDTTTEHDSDRRGSISDGQADELDGSVMTARSWSDASLRTAMRALSTAKVASDIDTARSWELRTAESESSTMAI